MVQGFMSTEFGAQELGLREASTSLGPKFWI